MKSTLVVPLCLAGIAIVSSLGTLQATDLTKCAIVQRSGELPPAEKMAASILEHEVALRTQLKLPILQDPKAHAGPAILLANRSELPRWKDIIPTYLLDEPILKRPESFTVVWLHRSHDESTNPPTTLLVLGGDARGVMYGVGYLIRQLRWKSGQLSLPESLSLTTSPDRKLRGHQIGYRARANSWDAWTKEQMEQYFRELILFGANAIENIPFQDEDRTELMKYDRNDMNLFYGELCNRYDLEHWAWVPVEFPADDPAKGPEFLDRQERFYRECKRLDAIFVPGGDPGNNPALPLLNYLDQMSQRLQRHHPNAKIWLSMQGFDAKNTEDVYEYLRSKAPTWFGGAVMGPSSPPLDTTRKKLPSQYPLRWYPDITHNVRCQYPIPWLDPAWGITLGREGVNPRPEAFYQIYQDGYRFTDGFLSYSDGIHDDFNKQLWSQLAWDPKTSTRTVATEYARTFFASELDQTGADGLMSLETNLRGPILDNGSVEGTLLLWQSMERSLGRMSAGKSTSNIANQPPCSWRFELHLMRAYCDAYVRRRQIYERDIEKDALRSILQASPSASYAKIVDDAKTILAQADKPIAPELRSRVLELADSLYHSIGYQTSVEKYKASGHERGCVIDYLDFPLNNRWWLEDQLDQGHNFEPTSQKKHLDRIVRWEDPGEGGFYEMLGFVGASAHVPKLFGIVDAMHHETQFPSPTQRNIGPIRKPLRLAWHAYLDVLPHLTFDGLDPKANYVVRLFAQRESPLMIDGKVARRLELQETNQQVKFEQVTEQWFEVPQEANRDGRLELHWAELDQSHLNWREYHYVTDLWLMKRRP